MIGTATFVMLITATAIADRRILPATRCPAPQEAAVTHAQRHRHHDLPLQAPAAEKEAGTAGGADDRPQGSEGAGAEAMRPMRCVPRDPAPDLREVVS
jgi:hypothetical protein